MPKKIDSKKFKKRDIQFAHFGNGLSVFDTTTEKNGDYERVAHINADREITYYVPLSLHDTAIIEWKAKNDDSYRDVCKTGKIFNTRPQTD